MKHRVAIMLVLLSVACTDLIVEVTSQLDRMVLPKLSRQQDPQPPSNKVFVVALDEKSRRHFAVPNALQWPRLLQARALQRLREFGARGVAIDLTYSAPRDPPEGDQALEEAIGSIPTVLAASVDLTIAKYGTLLAMPSIERFRKMAKTSGHTYMPTSYSLLSGFPRRAKMEEKPILPLYLAAAKLVDVTAKAPPRDSLVNFYGDLGSIPTVPIRMLVEAEAGDPKLSALIRGRVAFLGLVDDIQGNQGGERLDYIRTTYSWWGIPGVEAHATMAANVLDDTWIRTLSDIQTRILCASTAILITIFILENSIPIALFAIGLLLVNWSLLCLWLMKEFLIFIPPVSPLLVPIAVGLIGNVIREKFLVGRALREHRKKLFDKFPEEIAKKYARLDDLRELHIVHEEGIVLATDLEGYSAVRNALSVGKLEELETLYRHAIVAALASDDPKKRGIPVKFVGDAVTAYFPSADSANAVDKVRAIEKNIETLHAELQAKELPILKLRVGLAPGSVSCAVRRELDGSEYFDITSKAGSDAARLESLNKVAGSLIALPKEMLTPAVRETMPFLYLGRGLLNQGDHETRDVYVSVPKISAQMIELWTPLLEAIAAGDFKAIMQLQKRADVTGNVSKASAGTEFDLADSTKEHPVISFSKPVLAQFSRAELSTILSVFFLIGQSDPALKIACRSYIFAINHALDPVESTRHLVRALEMLKTVNKREESASTP